MNDPNNTKPPTQETKNGFSTINVPSGESVKYPAPTQNASKKADNIVFIGNKRLMNYVNSIAMQFKSSQEVIIKARGKFISKAIDIVEVAKRQESPKISVRSINIGTEDYENEGKKVKVSTIDISLSH
jgi:archaea-specific DNA-binding protein